MRDTFNQTTLRETMRSWSGRTGQVLTLRQNFVWTLVGNTIFAAAQWGMLAVIAKLGDPEMVGAFAFALALTAPVVIFANLKLRAVQATDVAQDFQFGHYLSLRLLMLGLAFIGICVFVGFSNYTDRVALVIICVAVAKCFDALSDILYGYLQLHERMDKVSISRIVQGIAQLLTLAFVLSISHDLLLTLLAWAVVSGAVTLLYDAPSVRYVRDNMLQVHSVLASEASLAPVWQWFDLKRLFRVALPLGFATMLGSLWFSIPRYVIQYYLGTYQLGIFAAIASLLAVGSTITTALGQSTSPSLAKHHAYIRYQAFDRLIVKLVVLGVLIGLSGIAVAWLIGAPVLTLLYTAEYAAHVTLMVWILVAMCIQFSYVFLGTGLQAMRDFRFFLPIQIASCILILVLSIVLVPIYGLVGAAWAMGGANVFELLFFLIVFLYVRQNARRSQSMVSI